ncbi:MAG: hypothetical protein CM15mP85_25000 [Rhodobacterales bacterium]|nr:MAG: hypothetical protein CM15mP85_25000 [Rhodobacterales bacterium]
MTAREALRGTIGGASVLKRNDTRHACPGYAADITAFKRDNFRFFQVVTGPPVASLVFWGPQAKLIIL